MQILNLTGKPLTPEMEALGVFNLPNDPINQYIIDTISDTEDLTTESDDAAEDIVEVLLLEAEDNETGCYPDSFLVDVDSVICEDLIEALSAQVFTAKCIAYDEDGIAYLADPCDIIDCD